MKFNFGEVDELGDGQVDVWLCSIECLNIDSNKESLLALLNEDELRRYRRFVFDKDKNVFLASRYLLRSLLSAYVPEMEPAVWEFDFNDNGKPSISKDLVLEPIFFNVSHSKNNVVLAFSDEAVLGVDIESFLRASELDKLARYSFSEKEFSQITKLEGECFRERFFSLWTLKEAYIKADGRGMSLPLKSFSFIFDEENKSLAGFESEHLGASEKWRFWQYETELDAFISLALKSESLADYKVRHRKVVGLGQHEEVVLALRGESRP